MKKVLAMAMAAMLSLSLVACGGGSTDTKNSEESTSAEDSSADTADEPEAATEEEAAPEADDVGEETTDAAAGDLRMEMVTDLGGVNDESFNMLAWEGHKQAEKDLGIKVGYVESHQESDYATNLETCYENGAGLIWGIGFLMKDSVQAAAEKNPDVQYGLIDDLFEEPIPENITGITFREQEPSFMVGYIAAKMSKTGTIGFVGGMDTPVIERFESGYVAGAKTANKDINVLINYAESFNDSAKGKAIAQKELQDGADVIFHASGASGNGVIEAVVETGKPEEGGAWAIGVDVDQNKLGVDNVLVSACKTVNEAILVLAREYAAGTLEGGKNITLGYAEDGVFVATTGDHVPAEIMAEVEAMIKQVTDGELVIPGTRDEVKTYEASLS